MRRLATASGHYARHRLSLAVSSVPCRCARLMASGARASRALVRGPRVGRSAGRASSASAVCPVASRRGRRRCALHQDGGEGYVELVRLPTRRARARTIEDARPPHLSRARLTDKRLPVARRLTAFCRNTCRPILAHPDARQGPRAPRNRTAHPSRSRTSAPAGSRSARSPPTRTQVTSERALAETHPMFLHNTQTKKKERFAPRRNGRSCRCTPARHRVRMLAHRPCASRSTCCFGSSCAWGTT